MSGISVYAHIRPNTAVEADLQTDKAGTYLVLSAGGLDIFIRGREKLLEIASMLEKTAQEWEDES